MTRTTARRSFSSLLVALLMTAAAIVAGQPAAAQQPQTLDLDLIVLTRVAGGPGTAERWEGTATTFATGEEWRLTLDLNRWGNLFAVCGRRGTWRLESTANPADGIAGEAMQFAGGEVMIGGRGFGRFEGLGASASPGWIPVFPGLSQLGGCSTGSVAANILPPLTAPLGVLSLADVAGVGLVLSYSPLAIGSLRFDLVPI